MDYRGKTAIVTGGTRGIGRAIAEALLRDGMNVCVGARSIEEIEQTVRELEPLGDGGVTGSGQGPAADTAAADAPSVEEHHVLEPEAVPAPTLQAVEPDEGPGLRIVPAG